MRQNHGANVAAARPHTVLFSHLYCIYCGTFPWWTDDYCFSTPEKWSRLAELCQSHLDWTEDIRPLTSSILLDLEILSLLLFRPTSTAMIVVLIRKTIITVIIEIIIIVIIVMHKLFSQFSQTRKESGLFKQKSNLRFYIVKFACYQTIHTCSKLNQWYGH